MTTEIQPRQTAAPAPAPDLQEREAQSWTAITAGWERWWPLFERDAQPVSDRLVADAGLAPGMSVLDVATGLGEPAVTAARIVGPAGRVVAIDCSLAMIDAARRRARALGFDAIDFREMNAEDPDFPAAGFDAILCRWGLMFIPDLDGALRRLRATLKPGGRFAASAWAEPAQVPFMQLSGRVVAEHAPTPEEPRPLNPFRLAAPGLLAATLHAAGFSAVDIEPFPVTFEFANAEAYTRFRRDMTTLDATLSRHHPPAVVEAAWQAVTEAARAYAVPDGTVRFVNTALIVTARA